MAGPFRYKAFISYSHLDKKWGRWLLRTLENYRIPKHLVGENSAYGPIPGRLLPIFQDREELPAASDLSAAVRAALHASEFLIVLCSPRSAASHWVNQEIVEFKKRHGEHRILAVIIDGIPFASEGDTPPLECFPPALRRKLGPDGTLSNQKAEPIAADIRASGDGRRLGRLKLIAGMIGVSLDDLVQRDLQRRQKRVTAITLFSLIAVLAMVVLTIAATDARRVAELRRSEAEGLVEFMLTDLREKLEPVGRLEALDSVASKAIGYYAEQRLEQMPDDSVGRRARALLLLGEIDALKGKINDAEEMFQSAWNDTSVLLSKSPDDPRRIFDHAQSVYWLGFVDWQRGQWAEAEKAFRTYKTLANRMVTIEPDNLDYVLEQAYTDNLLGMLYLRNLDRPRDAIAAFERVLKGYKRVYAGRMNERKAVIALADANSWLSEALAVTGHLKNAEDRIAEQLAIYTPYLAANPEDFSVKDRHLWGQLRMVMSLFNRGKTITALALVKNTVEDAVKLVDHDPENTDWIRIAAVAYMRQAGFLLTLDRIGDGAEALKKAEEYEARLREKRAFLPVHWRVTTEYRLDLLRAQLSLKQNDPEAALSPLETMLSEIPDLEDEESSSELLNNFTIAAHHAYGDALSALGRKNDALQHWHRVVELTSDSYPDLIAYISDLRARCLLRLGRVEEAAMVVQELRERGYAQADFMEFFKLERSDVQHAAE
ncbi:hypothetical protein JCM17844_30010 [Iodidimonas gelatinilytica]|uniref:TIR domain-containing protein n=1 Tax=Iodidimonas gelatinilytica TaxID=1236966 RepID=A0A5A7MUW5_9PROT|nr:toll/interleukin-1 receptor domain-containing protein [Iodidimonas gelatinilytica]GEQ99364.1 hypothetical protein JCM17844_30010 [Iodidimonas gelatinilytica]